jgi:riboflavin kinase/FMN adenylyltransferase
MEIMSWAEFVEGRIRDCCALTIGVFDGVHLGHQALIRRIVAAPGLEPTVLSFRQNPKGAVEIYNYVEKTAILESLGVKALVLIDFNDEFRYLSGKAFFDLLIQGGHMGYQSGLLVIGSDFHAGYQAGTDAQGFSAMAQAIGLPCEVLPTLVDASGKAISSSRIRAAIAAGNTTLASQLLGRPYHT